jgi:hypothetical protein
MGMMAAKYSTKGSSHHNSHECKYPNHEHPWLHATDATMMSPSIFLLVLIHDIYLLDALCRDFR